MIKKLHRMGLRSSHMYTAAMASVGLSFCSWVLSKQIEPAGIDRADRWGIFIGQWAPTLMAMGVALRVEETHMTDDEMRKMDSDMEMGSRTSGNSRVHAPAR
ncbi:hypothetical protein [Herbidospora cretacea]|uniref:hypothetical protein n=1 Tax=Herbidospora cretacea TaxID=28444 RepID=UPI0007747D0E|nr:hypothetical protein [Herbidospora cretacea]